MITCLVVRANDGAAGWSDHGLAEAGKGVVRFGERAPPKLGSVVAAQGVYQVDRICLTQACRPWLGTRVPGPFTGTQRPTTGGRTTSGSARTIPTRKYGARLMISPMKPAVASHRRSMTPSKIIRLAAASSGMRIRATNVAKLLAGQRLQTSQAAWLAGQQSKGDGDQQHRRSVSPEPFTTSWTASETVVRR